MQRTWNRSQWARYRYEVAAAILLTLSALGFLALAAFSYEPDKWPTQVKIQSPDQTP